MKLVKIYILVAILGISLYAGEIQYAANVKSLYLDKESTKTIGRVLPTTEVEIVKSEGARVLAIIKGWGENTSALYAIPGIRILNAAFTKGVEAPYKILESKTIKDKQYHHYAFEVYMDKTDLVNELEPLYEEAKTLYTNNCSMCHALHPTKEFKANQWPSIIKSMLSRTAIPKDKSHLVIQYVQKNASDVENQ